ncbi:MAG: HAD hydrolase-like protein [Magnetococcales bacterium]|nr:HAD hydrolase-like protein [Magnetococcales bacterium]
MGEKPGIGSRETLTGRYARYREMMCREVAGLDGVLRHGAMEPVAFLALADRYEVILLDAFGVLNVGGQPIPGAPEVVSALLAAGRSLLVVSNNASQSPGGILRRLNGMGFPLRAEHILSSGMAVGHFVAGSRYRDRPYFLVGSSASAEHYAPGAETWMVNRPGGCLEEAEYVLMCSNRDYYGGEQEVLLNHLLARKPLPVLLANPDLVAPAGDGVMEVVAGFTAMDLADRFQLPLEGIGKPFAPIFREAWRRFPGVPAARILMVGDTLDTDILGAKAMGFASCLTLSGAYVGMEGELDSLCAVRGIRPDYVVASIGG